MFFVFPGFLFANKVSKKYSIVEMRLFIDESEALGKELKSVIGGV